MPRMSYAHKREYTIEQRKTESARVRERYNDRVPVICEKMPESDVPTVDVRGAPPHLLTARPHANSRGARLLASLQKSKYLIPMDMTVGQLVYVLRKRISLPSDKAIFVFVNNTCVAQLASSAQLTMSPATAICSPRRLHPARLSPSSPKGRRAQLWLRRMTSCTCRAGFLLRGR